ncbi:major Facilitator Superfamily [Roseobacter denitrificans OCh 114]|uniref:Major Facilitator Superfamily n=2 Tax=Roseobacter denitrificans TaxID=2434 RepID=Q169L4_ROSDO|nr:major Facilitator Superfamily [Roseobacter denitrificans OCh 114]
MIIGPVAAHVAFVLELTLVPLLLPAMQSHLGLSVGDLAWIFNSYGIAVAVGVLLSGWCGDTFNPRKVFGYGVALFAVGSLLVAASNSFEMLLFGRAVQGLGAGVFSPLLPLLLTRASPLKPGRMLIVWGSIAGYVSALAPFFYGSFFSKFGWNIAFVFIALVALVALILLNRLRDPDEHAATPPAPKDYTQILRARYLWITFAYVFCTYGAITYYLFRLPVWLSDNDVRTASVGLALTVLWLTFSGLSTLLRNMVDSPHIRTIMFASPILIVVGFLLSYGNENLFFIVLSCVFVGAGLACSNAPSTQLILRFAPKGLSAASTSLDITFARLGGIAMVALLATAGFAFAFYATALSCFIAATCALIASRGLGFPPSPAARSTL